jgi:hypothetical protein
MLLAPRPKIPAVAERSLRPESVAGEMLLFAGIRGIHVSREQEIESVAASTQGGPPRSAGLDRPAAGRFACRTCACARRDSARRQSRDPSGSICSRGRSGNRGQSQVVIYAAACARSGIGM